MNKTLLSVCWLLLCTLILNAQTVDLELSINSSKPNPNLYTKAPITFTLQNKGNTTATNILVRSLICDPTVNAPNLFGQNSQIVASSSPTPTASVGTYDFSFQNWTIPQLGAGQTATLTFSVFILTEEERTILGHVIRADQNDSDSGYNNLATCIPTEDDEASFVLNQDDGGGGGGNERCQLSISNVVFPATISPGQAVNVQARITNNSTTAAAIPTKVNVYQFVDIHREPSAGLRQIGADIPQLAPGASANVQFTFTVPSPIYVNSIFPPEDGVTLGEYYLIIESDVENGSTGYLECNHQLDFSLDFPDIDLALSYVNNKGCYGENRVIQADLQLTNNSNRATDAPIYVGMGQRGFINPGTPNIVGSFRDDVAFWRIEQSLAPGQSVTLNRPFRNPNPNSTAPINLLPEILAVPSNIDDANPLNNRADFTFNFETNCGDVRPCDYRNQAWLQQRLNGVAGASLCDECIVEINAYELGGETYIEFRADNANCDDALTTIYNCDGTVFCRNGGLAGFTECNTFYASSPTRLETLWSRLENCQAGTCDFNNLPWLKAQLANNDELCRRCIGSIEAYQLNGNTYIAFTPDGINCADAPLLIYDCQGTAVCFDDGFVPFSTCQPFFNQNPTLLATIWNQEQDCEDPQEPIVIAARAWRDLNGDGFRDLNGGDAGIGNVRVRVESSTGQIVGETFTEVSGRANFPAFPAGTYRVVFDIPAGLEATIKDLPGVGSGRDSEINPDGKTDFFTFAPGDSETEIAGGFRTKTTGGGDKVDLELTGSTPNPNVGIYKRFPATFTLKNNSNVTATNVVVDFGACKDGQGFGSPTIFFDNNSGLVYSSPSPSVSQGSFSLVTRKWVIPSFAANSTATLTLNLFTLTADERAVIAEVRVLDQEDEDSSPANMSGCTSAEDDEAVIEVNGNGGGSNKPDFELKNVAYLVYQSDGSTISLRPNITIKNDAIIDNIQHNVFGDNPANGSYPTVARIVLSIDEIIGNADDIVVKERNETYSGDVGLFIEGGYGQFSIPSGVDFGRYNLILKIDADDQVPETNENNNTWIIRNILIIGGDCICPDVIAPVCGSDGVTYENACSAECAGIFDYTPGPCECICPAVVAPVCGSDGITYGNSCLAECAGIFDYTDGECNSCDNCSTVEGPPVCGSDGKTYQNACFAECAGIFNYTTGVCSGGDGVDLELEIVAPNSYSIYTKVLFQARLTNKGNQDATGVEVDFPLPNEFTHSANAATVGRYNLFREVWEVGTVKAGTTVVLDLTLFALGSDETIAYAQVATCNQNDVDSTPGNGRCCVADEDDEAVAIVASGLKNDNGTLYRLADIHRNLEITMLRPTVATNEIEVFVQSKMAALDLEIYDLQGNPVLKQKYHDTTGLNRLRVDISDLPTGMYLLRFAGTAGRQTVRFVKMQM